MRHGNIFFGHTKIGRQGSWEWGQKCNPEGVPLEPCQRSQIIKKVIPDLQIC